MAPNVDSSSKLKTFLTGFWDLLRQTFKRWKERDPFNKSVVISYYTIFSLPGLLVIITNVAAFIFGAEAVTHQITTQIGGMVGADTAKDIEEIMVNANNHDGTIIATILSVATMLFGATGVFYQLQQALNSMWDVKAKPKGKILKLVKDRLFSFGLILVVGLLLLMSLLLSAALAATSQWVTSFLSESLELLFKFFDFIISVGVITLLFAAIFKILPDVRIEWRSVWAGAFLTATLFTIAKFALGLYFANSNPGSIYGAAGTIILIMLWVSYVGLIVLFGAEFTQEYANKYGHHIEQDSDAISIEAKQ